MLKLFKFVNELPESISKSISSFRHFLCLTKVTIKGNIILQKGVLFNKNSNHL